MILELKPNEYNYIKTLADPVKFHLVINAIIDTKIPGRIWVDDINNPKSALIWDLRYSLYLFGREDNINFNVALKKVFTEEISPNALKEGIEQFFLICPEAWKTKILENEIIMKKSRLNTIPRCYYSLQSTLSIDWNHRLPPDCHIEFVDKQLFGKSSLKNFSYLMDEVRDIVGSVEEFLSNGNFGYCLIRDEKKIVSWCLSFLYGSLCEVWVQTVTEHRKKGFATLTVATFVEYCQNNDITIGWHSNQDNQASIKLAEKIGFERTTKEYSWVFGDY
ncbi:MAG: GNAT family N-acetyltransferase [Promethearchaeota archaeon]